MARTSARAKALIAKRMPSTYGRLKRFRHALREVQTTHGDPSMPANFGAWVDRLPSNRRPAAEPPTETAARVAVVLHVHYPDLLPDLLARLSHIPVAFDLIVTNSSGREIEVDCPGAGSVRVLSVNNHGRDIWPLVQVINSGLLDPYDVVLKVHTKKSGWRKGHELSGTGDQWRDEFLDALLPSQQGVELILSAFVSSARIGVVTAPGNVLGPAYWGDNENTAAALMQRLELPLNPETLSFPAGSMYWIRAFVLQAIRALGLTSEDFEPEAGQVNATTAHAVERLIGILTMESGLTVTDSGSLPPPADRNWSGLDLATDSGTPAVEIVPFYLPQFHPTEENNRWWGEGFTEWSNTASAKPVYHGHHQPKLPTNTGFYDLRLPEVFTQQARMAESAGISGFMYYHYWFAGRSILEMPIQQRLKREDSLPFCLMWANENWTRRWDGRSQDILMGQDYEHVDTAQFLEDVVEIMRDERYLRIGGLPLLAVYRPRQIPDVREVTRRWRAIAREQGLQDLYLLAVDVDLSFDGLSGRVQDFGFDGRLGFPPHRSTWPAQEPRPEGVDRRFHGNILNYQQTVDDYLEMYASPMSSDYYPGVMVGFDNTARRQWSADIWYGANPFTFHRWLLAAANSVMARPADHRIVFINAWNEWAEGATLEPNDRVGMSNLLAVRNVVRSLTLASRDGEGTR